MKPLKYEGDYNSALDRIEELWDVKMTHQKAISVFKLLCKQY